MPVLSDAGPFQWHRQHLTMKYLAILRHLTIQLLLMIVTSNAFVNQYNSVFIAILNPLNIYIDDLLTSYVVTGRFSIMGPLNNSIRFSTGWPMWAFTKAWAKLHMGFYEYIVHILLNYVIICDTPHFPAHQPAPPSSSPPVS